MTAIQGSSSHRRHSDQSCRQVEEIETAQQQLRQLEDQTNHKSQQHLRQFNNSSKGAEDQDELKRKLSLD